MPRKDANQRRAYQAAYMRGWYARNTERHKQSVKRHKSRAKVAAVRCVDEYLRGKTCARCPEADPVALEFHHNEPRKKHFSIGLAYRGHYSVPRIMAEIQKCTVLCANCHRKLHAMERFRRTGRATPKIKRQGRPLGRPRPRLA